RAVGKQAQELLAMLSEVGARLRTIAATKNGIEATLTDMVTAANVGKKHHAVEGQYRQIRSALNALALPDHLLRTLWDMGFGRVGVSLSEGHFSLRRPGEEWGTTAPEESVLTAVDQLKGLANSALAVLRQRAETKEAA